MIYFKCNIDIEIYFIKSNEIMEENEERNKIVLKYKRGRSEVRFQLLLLLLNNYFILIFVN